MAHGHISPLVFSSDSGGVKTAGTEGGSGGAAPRAQQVYPTRPAAVRLGGRWRRRTALTGVPVGRLPDLRKQGPTRVHQPFTVEVPIRCHHVFVRVGTMPPRPGAALTEAPAPLKPAYGKWTGRFPETRWGRNPVWLGRAADRDPWTLPPREEGACFDLGVRPAPPARSSWTARWALAGLGRRPLDRAQPRTRARNRGRRASRTRVFPIPRRGPCAAFEWECSSAISRHSGSLPHFGTEPALYLSSCKPLCPAVRAARSGSWCRGRVPRARRSAGPPTAWNDG